VKNLKIIKDSKSLIKEVKKYKLQKKKIGFVPTLGGLHKGHIKLIRLAQKKSDIVIVSIFLNPLQFNSKKDFSNYPINIANDKAKIFKEKVRILYIPQIKEIFLKNKIKKIKASNVANKLCGKHRKGHFNGVVTVLKVLFEQVSPHYAFFGEKDFQQVLIIKDLISKYNFKIKIILLPTVRNSKGLAYSSRNKLLTTKQKNIAKYLYKTINEISYIIFKNIKEINNLEEIGKKKLLYYGFTKVDYFKIYNENNLSKKKINKKNIRIFAAANLGKIRLIDNYKV
tara:strand:- start:1325 stop:2173 length:849 start_codon:yes stop_codon:yes gene_type:complete